MPLIGDLIAGCVSVTTVRPQFLRSGYHGDICGSGSPAGVTYRLRVAPSNPTAWINADRVSKSFGIKHLLDTVSLGVHEGQRIGVVGLNGGGRPPCWRFSVASPNPTAGGCRGPATSASRRLPSVANCPQARLFRGCGRC